jgi:hypothetical protein
MDWTTLVVALVVIGGWIAGNLKEIKKAAEKAAPPPPLPPPQPGAPAAFGRADDLQEFLKQIRRRAGENEPQPAAEPLPAILVEETTPRFEPSRIELPPVVPPPKPKKKNRPAPTSKPSRQKVDSPLMPAGLSAPSPPLAPDLPPASNRPKARSVDVREAVRLLKSPSGMKTAVILREILSEPLSKRRRGR